MSELQRAPILRAMLRTNLFMGCDRELMLSSIVVVSAMAFTSMNVIIIGISIALLSVIVHALRALAKSDPDMRKVYLKHIKYKPYYPAQSTPFKIER